MKKLRLSGVLQTIDPRTRQAADDTLSHQELLFRILHDEVERRESKQFDVQMRRANFETGKTLEDFDFDFTFNPKVPKARIIELATCNFVEKKRSVLLIGPAGVGKSHVAQALG